MLLVVLALTAGDVSARDKPKSRDRAYEFEPIKIAPSPYDGEYMGHFRFVNRRSKPVEVPIFDDPVDGRLVPRFIGFEKLENGSWVDLKIGYCGLSMKSCSLKPGVPYEFVCDLFSFKEQASPLTARISVGDFTSEPFVLNWAKDRANGAFVAAKKRNFQEVRTGLAKAGFKPELLEGDDFCARLLNSAVIEATHPGRGDALAKFNAKLDVSPSVELNGNIRIDFASDDTDPVDGSPIYRGFWVLNPKKFNSAWLEKIAPNHVDVSRWGTKVEMKLDDGSEYWGTDVRFYFSMDYVAPSAALSVPTDEAAKRTVLRILENLKSWMIKK